MKVEGEVRVIKRDPTSKYVDVAILEEHAANSVRCWAFEDAEGLSVIKEGDAVEADVFVSAKLSKAGQPYLSTQLRSVKVLAVAGSKPQPAPSLKSA